jgi:hypothetical protein
MKNTILRFIILLFAPSTFFGQQKSIEYNNQQWLHYYNQSKITEKWTFLGDFGYRWKNNFSEKTQYIVRIGAGFQLNSTISLNAGIAYLGTYKGDEIYRTELRPYQDLVVKNKYLKATIEHRIRAEQRFFKTKSTGADNFNFRFRYRWMTTIPVITFNAENPYKKLSINIGDEIFINAGKEIVYNVFDQNRLLIGATMQFNKKWALSFTYNHQRSAKNTPAKYGQDAIFWFAARHNLDFSTKKEKCTYCNL